MTFLIKLLSMQIFKKKIRVIEKDECGSSNINAD